MLIEYQERYAPWKQQPAREASVLIGATPSFFSSFGALIGGRWSIWVNGNWRVTFEFRDGHACVLDYEDYH